MRSPSRACTHVVNSPLPIQHCQPRFTERGFVVDESLNEIGEWYYYVVFRSDGEPLALPEPEPDEAKRAPKQKKRQDGAKPRGLGIKRRRK